MIKNIDCGKAVWYNIKKFDYERKNLLLENYYTDIQTVSYTRCSKMT